MSITSAQSSTLAAAIAADPTLTANGSSNQFQSIADAMNLASNPAVGLWMPNVATSVILTALLASDMTALSAGNIGYLQMLLTVGVVDATSANVRANFSTIFAGKTTLTNLIAAAQKTATRFEALGAFITVAGASSISTAYGIVLVAKDVQAALGKG